MSDTRPQPPTARLIADGLKLLQAGRFADLLRSVPQGSVDPRFQVQRAYAHAELGQVAYALAEADRAMKTPITELWALDLLGSVFTRCHRPTQAYEAFTRAAQVAPNRPEVLFNLATAAAFLGLTDQAEQAYDRIIAASPDRAEAYLNRSQLRRQSATRNHVDSLVSALGRDPLPWQSEVYLRYALGKELEDLGDDDAAFASIARGADVRRRHMRYSVAEDIGAMQRIAAVHDRNWCASARSARDPSGPIFVIGMPRSGSTLLERMLGRHTQVQSLGELPFFGQALVGAFRDRMGRMPGSKAELIDSSAGLDMSAMGKDYLSMAAPLRDRRPRFVDKLPINFLYAGLIARTVPGATLLHIRRNPLDLCFAVFKTLFRDGYPFSYDQAEMGAYHHAYRALMDHWREALGERLVEVDYEALVSQSEATMEALLPRLGLGFEEACLHPEKDATAVMTASAAQVRAPIHVRSVGSAARFAHHLAPLRAALGEGPWA
ncbi:sulfotransferase [Sphingomonas sp. ID0503]|uniref:tetratricopeptide repeat-containing sulfotransferase family protein n=1 Tax=Sphingomonas sp. ID0503 TaxID=3399691 RepID=UPI003AFB0EA6